MAELNDFIKLSDIVEKATNNTISLPTVQRGFVWKPYQIENLWDSLLRGYPVGAFVLSKKINSVKEEYELLDGQQRASAICLGFYNPLDESANANHEIFKTSNDNIMVFIDLLKPNFENDNRKYLFRVITKSHPWGYSRQENQKILESKHRNDAMGFFNTENNNYFKKPINEFWPYDSYKPIPLGLFINAKSIENLNSSIEEWKKELKVNEGVKLKVKNGENIQCYSIEEIFFDVKMMLAIQKIPLLFLDSSHLYLKEQNNIIETQRITALAGSSKDITDEKNEETVEDGEQGNIEDRNISEVENLFIRLNSGGTPLRGEELNYSVLKAHITDVELLKNIEKKSKGLFYPARFITIAFRLFNNRNNQNKANENDSISMKIKPRQFQRLMSDGKKDNFIKFIEEFLKSDIIDRVKKILIFNKETNEIGLPTFIAYSIADKAPEIMFMLLYRLYIKKDNITENSDLKPQVLGIITLFHWLGKGDKQRDHAKLLENIWPCVKNFDTEKRFWSEETIQRAMLMDGDNEILTIFPKLTDLKRNIPIATKENIAALTKSKIYSSASDYGNFIRKIFYNKDLILYAQRNALYEWFNEFEEYNLEDTNRAFDWDHICPSSYVYKQHNIPRALKDWYISNGNIRAWPYSLNRGDQDVSPFAKLSPTNDALESWCKSLNKTYSTKEQLKVALLELSVCDVEWLNLKCDIKERVKNNAKQIIEYILNRNFEICKQWYKNFEIDKLIPKKQKSVKLLFENIINQNKWRPGKEKVNEYYTYIFPLGENNLSLYFSFNIGSNTLHEGYIYFGFRDLKDNVEIKEVKIPNDQMELYQLEYEENYCYIGKWFTLISYSENSQIKLFNEFNSWLSEFPKGKIRDVALTKFNESIKAEFRNEICSL